MASQLANDIIGLLKDSCEQIKNLKEENGKLKSENRKLRYERLMAKAAYFHEHGVMLTEGWGCEAQCDRIAEAYEARAKRIKEQM